MHEPKVYRHCPERHNKPCHNHLCEHQCFMQEEECRWEEHKECPVTTLNCRNPLCIGREEHCELHKNPWEQKKFIRELIQDMKHDAPHHEQAPINVNVKVENIIITQEEHNHKKHYRVKLVLSGLTYKNFIIKNSIIMAISLNVNEFVTSTLGLVDHATQAPITDASFSNQTYTSDQPGIASVDDAGKVSAVSAGTANITFTADVAYTGLDGQPKTETGKTLVVAVTVTGSTQTTDLTVTFSAPQPTV